MTHPLDWRREVMVDCDCCHQTNQVCRICGWHEDRVNDPKVHEAHQTHILKAEELRNERKRYEV